MNYVRVGLAKHLVKGIFYTLDFEEQGEMHVGINQPSHLVR